MPYSSSPTVGTAGQGTGTTQQVSMTGVPNGVLMVVSFGIWCNTTGESFPTSLTDSLGNTFTRRELRSSASGSEHVSVGQYEGIIVTGSGSWNITLSITSGGSARQWDVVPMYWAAGNPASSEFDVATGQTGTSATLSTGTLPTTSATTELAVASYATWIASSSAWSGSDTPNGASVAYSNGNNSSLQAHRVVVARQGDGTGPIDLHSNASFVMTTAQASSGNYPACISSYVAAGATFDPATIGNHLVSELPPLQLPQLVEY